MTSVNVSINILISFLKHYQVRHLVLSPGTRNIPFVTAVETDPFFICHSVVDERNAAFYALGIAQATKESVGIACTSGTAVSNYLTGLTEAYNSRTPVVAITCDRSPYVLDQLETQKIDQVAALRSVVKYSADLPVLKDRDDVWYFERLLNEAFIALKSPSAGPVHVNMPLVGDTNAMWDYVCRQEEHDIKYIDYIGRTDVLGWEEKRKYLASSKRVLLVMGQGFPGNLRLKNALAKFCNKFKCPVLADNLSNVRCNQFIPAEAVIKGFSKDTFEAFLPDVVITLGMNFQERIKDLFKAHSCKSNHWGVDPCGKIRDCFKSQTVVFESKDEEFLEKMVDAGEVNGSEDYLNQWKTLAAAARLPEVPYGNFYAIKQFLKVIPDNALLHVSILNAVRLAQFFILPETVEVYANASSFGIDGCLPTFMGQAVVTDKPSFIIIGDISFFYAMNALSIKGVRKNVHVFLVNNRGAAEFHIPPASNAIPTIDQHIGVAHSRTAKAWAEVSGYEYLSATDESSFAREVKKFVRADNDKPILFEVFTDMRKDGETTLQLYRDIEANMRGEGVI